MAGYNAAFFSTHETYLMVLKDKYGEAAALDIFKEVMQRNLKKAYDSMGFTKGSPEDFIRVIKERDESVGLDVELSLVEERIIYRFHTDPFPNLRGVVAAEKIDATYMSFKVSYLLGDGWSYKTTKHIWSGDQYTEHVISKK